jgi:hypothetical protein
LHKSILDILPLLLLYCVFTRTAATLQQHLYFFLEIVFFSVNTAKFFAKCFLIQSKIHILFALKRNFNAMQRVVSHWGVFTVEESERGGGGAGGCGGCGN